MDDSKKPKSQLVKDLQRVRKRLKALESDKAAEGERVSNLRRKNRDLTKRLKEFQKTHQEVVQKERLHALGQMASGIVHDFNNALTPILGASDFLLSNPQLLENKDETLTLLESVRTAARDAQSMVSRLRGFYRARDNIVTELVDVNPLIEQVVQMTQPKWERQAQARGVSVSVKMSLKKKMPSIVINASQLREVLTNMILNAVDAMPSGGTITISSGTTDGWVLLDVKDTGEGMSEEVRQRCFEPFFSTKGKNGTGMGLAMVYGIIRQYHGKISIDSEVSKGTRIRIQLPVAPETVKKRKPSETEIRRIPSLYVLVVDDDSASRDIVSRYLTVDGHKVVLATCGAEAIKKCQDNKFDLILLDVVMPKVSGLALITRMREMGVPSRIIVITGSIDLDGQKKVLSNVDAVVGKPVTQSELREAIASVIA